MAGTNPMWEPPTLDLSVDRYNAFKVWHDRWTDYSIVTKLDAETPEYRCSMLRYTFTEDTRKIYNTLGLTAEESKDEKVIIQKLETFAKGTVNETLERHTFNSRNQEEDEAFDDFLTDLKVLIKNCNFCANCIDGLLRDRIVGGIRDPSLRQKLLGDIGLTLKKAEDACRAKEKAVQGVKILNKDEKQDSADVDEVSRRMNNFRPFRQQQPQHRNNNNNFSPSNRREQRPPNRADGQPCKFCTDVHHWGIQFCPAWDKNCTACGIKNHTKDSQICKRKKNIRNLNQNHSEEEEEDIDFFFLGSVRSETEFSSSEL